jgi:hypothetical protein
LPSCLLSKDLKTGVQVTSSNSGVVLCRCETLNLIFRDGHLFSMFENRVLRRMCGPSKKEVARS